ncbi:hypothetical protein L208DRAFT_1378237 [Tricholoma matsutake]|nr:hypothetical protein L208DRAFT_1378237 [Tricholoma matsutake 945]
MVIWGVKQVVEGVALVVLEGSFIVLGVQDVVLGPSELAALRLSTMMWQWTMVVAGGGSNDAAGVAGDLWGMLVGLLSSMSGFWEARQGAAGLQGLKWKGLVVWGVWLVFLWVQEAVLGLFALAVLGSSTMTWQSMMVVAGGFQQATEGLRGLEGVHRGWYLSSFRV